VGAGIDIALLMVAQSDQETRKMLKGRADEEKEYLNRRSSELRETASEVIERGKVAIGRQKDTLAEAVEAGKRAYRETIGQPTPSESPVAR